MIRPATADDLPLARDLYREFGAEIADAPWRDDDSAEELADLERALQAGGVFLADDAGLAVARKTGSRVGDIDFLYVRPAARRTGVGADLVREAARWLSAQGVEVIEIGVLEANAAARAAYERLGFHPVEMRLAQRVDALLGTAAAQGPTFGTIHVQTDDASAVERNAVKALPRFGKSTRTDVTGPVNGWVTVSDALADREPRILHGLAKELSYTSGGVVLALGVEAGAVVHYTLFDRGSVVDEYVSVPEFFGPLPPGDVVALGANPTVVARLTGAEPGQVREVARTASFASELPPWNELYEQVAAMMGVEVSADAV